MRWKGSIGQALQPGTHPPHMHSHCPLGSTRVAGKHGIGDGCIFSLAVCQLGRIEPGLDLQPQQMDAHQRHNGRQLRVAARYNQRIVEMATVVDEVAVRPGMLIYPGDGRPDRRAVGTARNRFGGGPCHHHGQSVQNDQKVGCFGTSEGPDIGTSVARQRHHALRLQPRQRFAHRPPADPERLRYVGLDQLLGWDDPASEDRSRDPVYDPIRKRRVMGAWFGAASRRAGGYRAILSWRMAAAMVDNCGLGKERQHGQS